MNFKLIKKYPFCEHQIGNIIHTDCADYKDYSDHWEEIKEPQFKIGDWVTRLHESDNQFLARITKIDGDDYTYTGFDWKGNWFENVIIPDMFSGRDRLATLQEIETHLIAEAKIRYPIGTKVKSALRDGTEPSIVIVNSIGRMDIIKGRIILWNIQDRDNLGFLYDNGNWAEIVKEEPIKIGEYEVKFQNKGINIGCKRYEHKDIENLYEACMKFGIDNFRAHSHTISFSKVKEVYRKFD